VDFRHWDKAVQFWSDLSGGRLTQVRQAVASLSGPEGDIQVSADHKVAVVCKAWPHYLEEEDFDVKDILPKFGPTNEAGKRKLAEAVDLRGLDLGSTIDRALAKAAQKAAEGHPQDDGYMGVEEEEEEGAEEEWEEAEEAGDLGEEESTTEEQGEQDPTPEQIAAAAEHQRKAKETKRQRDKDKLIANRAERKRTARQAEMQATVQAATQGPPPSAGAPAPGGPT
jgi:hypothetical protein